MKRKKTRGSRRNTNNTDRLLKLYEIYDNHRDAILWFLEELDAKNYEEYLEKYSGASSERSHFISVCGFFELSGVLVNYDSIDQNLYFDIFNPTPFWDKAKPIVEGMRTKRPHIYENFELLNNKRLSWTKKRKDGRSKLLLERK
ncbi:MAG TPA: hypothetical protein VEH06_04305 [Candidatus Bathyarchaeia archaeon]|nr:hypothetical protein [Candidatus Bathyarchaeia archaeon]